MSASLLALVALTGGAGPDLFRIQPRWTQTVNDLVEMVKATCQEEEVVVFTDKSGSSDLAILKLILESYKIKPHIVLGSERNSYFMEALEIVSTVSSSVTQLFVKGEFFGSCAQVLEMKEKGILTEVLQEAMNKE